MTTLAILHSTVRTEEKRIAAAAKSRKVKPMLIDIRTEIFNPETYHAEFDLALQRSVSTVKGLYATGFLESIGVPVVNSSSVSQVCENKFLTSLRLLESGVPTAKFALVFELGQALEALEALGGFPVVIKPPLGSWGRLLSKVNDQDALETVLEHKSVLGSPQQKAFYLQEYIPKKGRDIRAFIVGNQPICAIYRESQHWITNTARGASVRNCPLTEELTEICRKTAAAVGEGLLAVDIFETRDGLKVNEVNHTMEFKNSEQPTGINIAGEIVDYCLERVGTSAVKSVRTETQHTSQRPAS